MGAAIFCYAVIGGVIGSIFALLFINFDKSWKKIQAELRHEMCVFVMTYVVTTALL